MGIILVALLGLCGGSFAEAYVWRIHKQAKLKKPDNKYSITRGHSMCPQCKHRLHAKDLVPLLSWLELRGQCRYCQAKIGWQVPAIEILTATLFIVSFVLWPFSLTFVGVLTLLAWLVCVVLLVALAVYDIRWMLLPDRMVTPLVFASGALAGLVSIQKGDPNLVWWSLGGAIILAGLFWVLFQVSDGKWIGGGDVKIAVALGIIAGGPLQSILLLFMASLLGSLYGIPVLMRGRKASHKVPFGPFLIAATFIVFLWGQLLIDWYGRLLGY